MISKEIQQSDQWGKDLKKLDRREWDDATSFFFLVASHTGKKQKILREERKYNIKWKRFWWPSKQFEKWKNENCLCLFYPAKSSVLVSVPPIHLSKGTGNFCVYSR